MVLARWDPFQEALSLRDAMNRLFDQAVLWPGTSGSGTQAAVLAPALDVAETPNEFTVTMNLPGVKPENVDIQVEQGVLTVSGEISESQEQTQRQYHIRERRQGRFMRSVTLPSMIDADKVQAAFEHGVLTIHLPKTEAVKPRRIQIQGA